MFSAHCLSIVYFSTKFRENFSCFSRQCKCVCVCAQREITSQSDLYLVILSSKTYVFEDKLTPKFVLVSWTSYFFQCVGLNRGGGAAGDIISFKSLPPFKRETQRKMTELLPV